ncbi:hypothetical protein ACFFNY_35425 [Paenibacillus hodogayensis]|uniref:Uncharacterized protein n=1 Tax=Paenibacillus hodogayensis TaxID=279208 RepID=A0ABV5W8I7_9BACL
MNVWGLVFAVFVPAMAVLMFAFSWLSHATVRRTIGSKHRALEEIHLTNKVPSFWTDKYDRKLHALGQAGTDARAASEWTRRKRNKVLSKLDGLIGYTQRTKLVAEEEVRLVLLDALHMLRAEWQER